MKSRCGVNSDVIRVEVSVLIRAEEQRDWAAVRAVNVSAFETPAEANLVDALRDQAQPLVSLVAETMVQSWGT